MARKRCLFGAGVFFVVLCVCGFVVHELQNRPGISIANLDRIENGMTREEVDQILGDEGEGTRWSVVWMRRDRSAAIVYFENDRVCNTEWHFSQETRSEKICRWLHLPKSWFESEE